MGIRMSGTAADSPVGVLLAIPAYLLWGGLCLWVIFGLLTPTGRRVFGWRGWQEFKLMGAMLVASCYIVALGTNNMVEAGWKLLTEGVREYCLAEATAGQC